MTAKPKTEEIAGRPDRSQWVARLGQVLSSLEVMERDERHAALKYIKSVYGNDWPGDSY